MEWLTDDWFADCNYLSISKPIKNMYVSVKNFN